METEQTIEKIMVEVAGAIKDAAAQYGPDAVNLALTAYQVYAIRELLIIPIAIVVFYAVWRFWVWFVPVSKECSDETDIGMAWTIVTLVTVGVCTPLALFAAATLTSPALWLAAFGHPEVLIATRALEAAGLM